MFSELDHLKSRLAKFAGSYWIAGGWAIDIALGRQTRAHKDIEVAIARDDQHLLLQLPRLAKIEYIEKSVPHLWNGPRLELPVHEMYCHFEGGETLEVLLNEFDATDWIYRRNPAIRLSREKFSASGGALPLEVALLFKSKHMREIDQKDYINARAFLNAESRAWLRRALEIESPGHLWLTDL